MVGWVITCRQGEGPKCTQGTMNRLTSMKWGLSQSIFAATNICLVFSTVGHCCNTQCEGQVPDPEEPKVQSSLQVERDTLGMRS